MEADSTSAVAPDRDRKRGRRRPGVKVPGVKVPGVKVNDAIRLLTEHYGPFVEEPRLDPAHEVVLTILSQHTSDTNSARAFRLLMDRFGSLEAVAEGEDEQQGQEHPDSPDARRAFLPRIQFVPFRRDRWRSPLEHFRCSYAADPQRRK